MDALYEKAKLEKTVVLYGAGPTGSHDRWIKDFEQRFPGVTVAFTGGLSTSLNQRIERQLASGPMETDLAILQTIQDFGKWKKAGAQPWCATPTATLCCGSKESWIDDRRTAAATPLSRSGIRADRPTLNQHGTEYRSGAARVFDLAPAPPRPRRSHRRGLRTSEPRGITVPSRKTKPAKG